MMISRNLTHNLQMKSQKSSPEMYSMYWDLVGVQGVKTNDSVAGRETHRGYVFNRPVSQHMVQVRFFSPL